MVFRVEKGSTVRLWVANSGNSTKCDEKVIMMMKDY